MDGIDRELFAKMKNVTFSFVINQIKMIIEIEASLLLFTNDRK